MGYGGRGGGTYGEFSGRVVVVRVCLWWLGGGGGRGAGAHTTRHLMGNRLRLGLMHRRGGGG